MEVNDSSSQLVKLDLDFFELLEKLLQLHFVELDVLRLGYVA